MPNETIEALTQLVTRTIRKREIGEARLLLGTLPKSISEAIQKHVKEDIDLAELYRVESARYDILALSMVTVTLWSGATFVATMRGNLESVGTSYRVRSPDGSCAVFHFKQIYSIKENEICVHI